MQIEKQTPNPQQPEQFHEKLETEIQSDAVFEHTEDDTLSYVTLSTGIRSLLLSSQKAAKAVDLELQTDDKRAERDPRRLSPDERQKYEEYLTEVHSWTFLLPHLLRTTRSVQYNPEVLEAMDRVTTDISQTLNLGESLETSRLGILARSQTQAVGRSIEDLASIATYEWLQRMRLSPLDHVQRNKGLLTEHIKSVSILRLQEEAYKREMMETEASQKSARSTVDEQRTLEGTARVAQGYPGSALLLDRPEISLNVWKRLLIEGGPRERVRGAEELGQAVEKFQSDFLEKEALKAFEAQVHDAMQALILENKFEQEKSKRILGFLLGDFGEAGVDRLVTHPEEFKAVEEAIQQEVRAAFEKIAVPEHEKIATELRALLQAMQEGKEVDTDQFSKVLGQYLDILVMNRDLMSAVQRWQVAQNVLRVGGRGEQTRAEQMMDQAVRLPEGKSGIEWMRRMAPYGSFQTRGYISPNGRFMLLPHSDAVFSRQGPLGHTIEAAKGIVDTAAVGALTYALLSISRLPSGLKKAAAVVAIAEFNMAVMKGAAHQERITQGVARMQTVIDDLHSLEQGTDREGRPIDPRLRKQLAVQAGNELFSALLVMLQSAKASNNPQLSERAQATPQPAEVVEAHLYANQMLTAFGFPGYHQLPDGLQLPDHRDPTLSPEARLYLEQRQGPTRDAVIAKTKEQLKQLRTYEDRLMQPKSSDPQQFEISRAQRFLEAKGVPSSRTLPEMKELLTSEELEFSYKQFTQNAVRADVLRRVGGWVGLHSQMNEALLPVRHPTAGNRIWQQIKKELFGSKAPTVAETIGNDRIQQWQIPLKNVRDTTLMDFLHHLRYIQENPPTNAEIEQWYKDAGVKGISSKQIDAFYGKEGQRQQMTNRLLTSWLELQARAKEFVDLEQK